jgi:lipopolysaccharide export system protein LptA
VRERDRTATCDDAIFYRAEDRIVCNGKPAQLTQACDRVTGDKITFQIDSEKLEVEGNSKVEVRPCNPPTGTPPASGAPPAPAPGTAP